MTRDINLQLQQAIGKILFYPKRINPKKFMPRHIIIKPQTMMSCTCIAIARATTKKPMQGNILKTTIKKSRYNPKNVQETNIKVRKEKQRMRTRGNKLNTNNKMAYLNPNISIITLNVNVLNTPIKRDWQSGFKKPMI